MIFAAVCRVHDEKIDDYFFVLRVIGKEGDISQRQIAKTLSLSVGKVNGAIKRLAKDGLITNSRNCKVKWFTYW